MKKNILCLGMALAMGFAFNACKDDAAPAPVDKSNGVGIKSLTDVVNSDGSVDVTLTVEVSKAAVEAIEVGVSIDAGALPAAYYQAVAAADVDLGDAKITIAKDATTGSKVIHVNSISAASSKIYALPLAISATGEVTVDADKAKGYVVVSTLLGERTVPNFRIYRPSGARGDVMFAAPVINAGTDSVDCNWTEPLETDGFTVEFWAMCDKYSTQNFAIISSALAPDWTYENYFRFGDANQLPNSNQFGRDNGRRCYVNWKVGATSSVNLTGAYDLIASQWNHWALTYEGTTGVATIYKNGAEYLTDAVAEPDNKWQMNLFILLSSHTSTTDSVYLNEVRLWTKALTAAQISANMTRTVNPASEGLEAYWPLTQETYNEGIFKDLTSNNHDLYVRLAGLRNGILWIGGKGALTPPPAAAE